MAISISNAMEKFQDWLTIANLDSKYYQLHGIQFMLTKELLPEVKYRGGILADEMGLGKTIQMLGLIYSNFCKRTLIVLPNALLNQWENEIKRLFGHSPCVYHGSRKQEKDIIDSPIVLTTYGTLASRNVGSKKIKSDLTKYHWNRVIFDEAHHLRNKKTNCYHGAKNLTVDYKWFVTGTPIQNRVNDLLSLCSLLGIETKALYSTSKIQEISKDLVIRRTKTSVGITLPNIHNETIVVNWENDEEHNIAADIHQLINFTNITYANVNRLISMLTKHHLPALVRMRQMCILPSLITTSIDQLVQEEEIDPHDIKYGGLQGRSKMQAVVRHIYKRQNNGNAKLVFCHYRGEIHFIQQALTHIGFKVGVIAGNTSHKIRQSIITDRSIEVMILQVQTGCEGLNLQHYNEIYFTSPHWNPAVEDQAVARAHRIGQTKPVYVYRFIMDNFDSSDPDHPFLSIDQYCLKIQTVKRELQNIFV